MHTNAADVPSVSFRRFYVWELPVRVYHWLNALCIVILTATGFIMANPPAIVSASEASFSYWFGIVRFIHFLTAYVFVINFAVRIYWGFVGNQYADWRNFMPFRRKQFREVQKVLRSDILQAEDAEVLAVGHNALAYLTYFVMFLMFLCQVITGFALYASMSHSWFPQLFTWIIPTLGGDAAVRSVHHLATWFFIIFTFIHVYLVAYHEYVEGHGVLTSIVGGWKFLPNHEGDGKSWFSGKKTDPKA